MRRALIMAAGSFLTACSVATAAELAPGLYEVDVRLELPNLDAGARRSTSICIAAGAPAFGLRVLSDNNSLALCALSDVVLAGDRLTFKIACAGGNAARGEASYVLGDATFHGRIAMKMGGKNMTMSEVQDGRRTGDCDRPGPRTQ